VNVCDARSTIVLISLAVFAPVISGIAVVAQTPKTKCDGSTVENFSPSLAPRARAFLADLQASVKADDRQRVAMMCRFPLRVWLDGRVRRVRNQSELVKDYDRVFTSSMKKAIASQIPECLFANWQGVMIGRGEVWFEEEKNGSLEIKTLNVMEP